MINTLHKKYRSLFKIPKNWIYLDGNSLGPLQKNIIDTVSNVTINEWGEQIIKGWNESNWIKKPDYIGNQIAKLIGANENSVTVGDTLSIKLYQAISAAIQISKKDGLILSDISNFPSDLYIANSLLKEKNLPPVKLVNKLDLEKEMIRGKISILMLTHVDYRTGELHDLKKINKIAKDMDIITIWDFAHSIGSLPINVQDDFIDFAVGCTYKFLCGGPGSPAFLYVNPKHIKKIDPAIAGWLGHENPFNFDLSYKPAHDIKKFKIGTPPVIQMAILEKALKIWENLDINLVRKEAQLLTSIFIDKINKLNLDLKLISPKNSSERGNQVSYETYNAYEKMQTLIDFGVIGDYREPNIMRFGFNPLYNSEKDVIKATKIFERIIKKKIWKNYKYSKRNLVT